MTKQQCMSLCHIKAWEYEARCKLGRGHDGLHYYSVQAGGQLHTVTWDDQGNPSVRVYNGGQVQMGSG